MNIYELPMEADEAMKLYLDCFDQETGEQIVPEEVAQSILEELNRLQNKKDEIIEWMLKKRGNAEANIAGLSEEIKRLQARVSREKNTVDRMENLVKYFVPTAEKPVTISNWTVSYRKSEAVRIDDLTMIPHEYIKYSEPVASADKVTLKDILKTGISVPGASLEVRSNLQIK